MKWPITNHGHQDQPSTSGIAHHFQNGIRNPRNTGPSMVHYPWINGPPTLGRLSHMRRHLWAGREPQLRQAIQRIPIKKEGRGPMGRNRGTSAKGLGIRNQIKKLLPKWNCKTLNGHLNDQITDNCKVVERDRRSKRSPWTANRRGT
jgi:hypothetical protein